MWTTLEMTTLTSDMGIDFSVLVIGENRIAFLPHSIAAIPIINRLQMIIRMQVVCNPNNLNKNKKKKKRLA